MSFDSGYSKLKTQAPNKIYGDIKMILLTGAAGKTGQAVLKALVQINTGIAVSVLVRHKTQAEQLKRIGAVKAVVGDMLSADSYNRAMRGVTAVYHICPNMHPGEIEIGRLAIAAACEEGLQHFVYHSVLHPQTEKMPHHWNKMRVEEMLFESDLNFTILQPAPYMQNILASREKISGEGVYRMPYPVNTRLSLVDLQDLARAAAIVLNEPGHKGAIYEIVGTGGLSQLAVAEQLSDILGRDIAAEEQPLEEWRRAAENIGLGAYQVETLVKMFAYYARYGLEGNSNILSWLLKSKPNCLHNFLKRAMKNDI